MRQQTRRPIIYLMTPRQEQTQQTLVSRILGILDLAQYQTPSQPEGAPTLVLTVGLPGSGKSTFSRRLAHEVDFIILESDALRRVLFGTPTYSISESRMLFGAIYTAAAELLLRGQSLILDATNVRESDRTPAYRLAQQTGARLLLLQFSASEDVTRQRLHQRREQPDAADSSSADLQIYEAMAARAEPLTREHLNIDTSNAAESEAVFWKVVADCRPLVAGGIRMGGVS